MVINNLLGFTASDVPKYMWNRLRHFSNVNHTAGLIQALHQLPAKHHQNARRQAEQVRYCLLQAREFYEAAESVSLATRPTLLYYSAMSLALAEVLLKQTGDSRLSKLRAQHGSHGLVLSLAAEPKVSDDVHAAATLLLAKQQIGANGPAGTFEVWRRSAREYPLGGYQTTFHHGATTTGFKLCLTAEDKEFLTLPATGISLYECLVNLHTMIDAMRDLRAPMELVRATISEELRDDIITATLIVHPHSPAALKKFGDSCRAEAAFVNDVEVIELPSGFILRWKHHKHISRFILPPGTNVSTNNIYFSTSRTALNEFGYLYIALHLTGTFARYYPDIWVHHLEEDSALALAVSALCAAAATRLPLLAASELSRSFFMETET